VTTQYRKQTNVLSVEYSHKLC